MFMSFACPYAMTNFSDVVVFISLVRCSSCFNSLLRNRFTVLFISGCLPSVRGRHCGAAVPVRFWISLSSSLESFEFTYACACMLCSSCEQSMSCIAMSITSCSWSTNLDAKFFISFRFSQFVSSLRLSFRSSFLSVLLRIGFLSFQFSSRSFFGF